MTRYQSVGARDRRPKGGFYYFCQESTEAKIQRLSQLGKPASRWCFLEAAKHVDSTRKKGLTKLPPLTHTYTIEELRPEDNPCGRFCFPDIADPVLVAGHAGVSIGMSPLP